MKNFKKSFVKALFVLPSFVGVTIFFLVPLLETLGYSFSNAVASKFVGIKNYIEVFQNEAFILASKNTIKFVIICIPLLLVFSLLLALAVHSLKRLGHIFKSSFLIPMAIPVASIVFLWQLLFNKYGLLNRFLISIGANPVDFMNTSSAFWVLIFTYLWKNSGYHMILWLSGLSAISGSLYEAASIDGANSWVKFWYITLPSLVPTLVLSAILGLINSFKVFREAYLVAGSYPHESIYMLQHLFNNWFVSLDIPKISAAAMILSVVISLLITLLSLVWRKKD